MASATVTSKGRMTIPAAIRTALGLKAGSRIEFIENEKVNSPSFQRRAL